MARELGDPPVRGNPWLRMWVKPRETIRGIVTKDPDFRLYHLAAIYGFPMLLQFAQSLSLATTYSFWAILIASMLLSIVAGMLGFTISSALVHWIGKWLGGVGSFREIRAAIAWSSVPNVAVIVLWIILMGLFGGGLFYKEFPEMALTGWLYGVTSLIFVLMTVLSVWSFILLITGVSEVQKFSVWRGIVNIILPFVIVSIALWAIFVFVCWAIGMKS